MNTMTLIINLFYRKGGIADESLHAGRRSGLTTLANREVDVRVLIALAGHRPVAPLQHYIDLRLGVVRAAVVLV